LVPAMSGAAVELLDVVGQDAAVAQLQRGLASDRLPHALLLAGPAGVGRRTTATALARALLCAEPARRPNAGRLAEMPDDLPLTQACGRCPDCRLMAAGSHPDFHLVSKELAAFHDDPAVRDRKMQELGIDVVRSFLIEPAGRASTRGRGKVFVVLEAELMSTPAQHALLKTLEEPPPGVTIALLCRTAEQMLATTRSRCAVLRFGPLPRAFVSARLAEAGVSAPEAEFWAAFTGGSVGEALRLAAGGKMYRLKQDLLERLAALGPAGDAGLGEHLASSADALAKSAVAAAKKQEGSPELARTLATRQAAQAILRLIASAFRDAMALAVGAGTPLANVDQTPAVRALAERLGPDRLAEALAQVAEYERLLWRNVNPKLIWDNVAITCASGAPMEA